MSVAERRPGIIETVHDAGDLVRVLDRLADVMERDLARQTQVETLLRGLVVNDVLWSGGIVLPASGAVARRSFQAPYAAITIDDPNGVGPIFFANGDGGELGLAGVGAWSVAKDANRTFAMVGTNAQFGVLAGNGGVCYVTVWARWPGRGQ